MMMIQNTHNPVHAALEALRDISLSMSSCRLLILVARWYQGYLEQLIGVECSSIVSMWHSVILLVL